MKQSCRRLYVFEDGDDFDEDEFDDHHDGDDEFDEDDFDAYATCKRAPSAIPVWLKTMLS